MEQDEPRKISPYVVILVASVIIITIVAIFILSREPLWQQYNKIEEETKVIYKNEELDTEIWIMPENYRPYYCQWGPYGKLCNTSAELREYIKTVRGSMSDDQYKWFEYMLENVIE